MREKERADEDKIYGYSFEVFFSLLSVFGC